MRHTRTTSCVGRLVPLLGSKDHTVDVLRLLGLGAAGAAGALSRYGIGAAFGSRAFPWPTLGINLLGSFLLGLLLSVAAGRGWSNNITVPLGTGFLGAFTTFSTFSYETQLLLRMQRPVTAAIYVAASVAGGVAAAWGGFEVGRLLP